MALHIDKEHAHYAKEEKTAVGKLKYLEVWSEDLGHIIGVKEVNDDHEQTPNEILCTKQFYKENKLKFTKTKKFDNGKVISFLLMKDRSKATEEIVNMIKENFIIKTTRSDISPEMWVYKEGIYLPEARTVIKEACREILGEAHTTHLTNDVINKIEADTYIDEEEFFNKQNDYPYLLPVQNGLLNIKNKKLQMFNHEIPFFNKVNSFYKPSKDCPVIKKFLKQILASEEDYKVIQELIGFCLLRRYKYEKAFMLYGSHGRNGKSKLLELIKTFIGADNVSGVSLQDVEKDDFAISNLHNKLVNISGDISNEAIKANGKFKQITGQDTLSANRKFKNRINFVNYATVIFGANELPAVYTLSNAFWLRWVLVEFPYRFLPQKEINAIPLEDRKDVFLQNPDIIKGLVTRDELDGLLNFALDGLDRLELNKDFSTTLLASELSKDWQRKSNSMAAFIEDNIIESYDDYIPKGELLKEYQYYCKKHSTKIMSDKVIKETLKTTFGVIESRPFVDGLKLHVWNGIKFK